MIGQPALTVDVRATYLDWLLLHQSHALPHSLAQASCCYLDGLQRCGVYLNAFVRCNFEVYCT